MYMSGVSSDVSDYGSEKGAMSCIEAMAGFGNLSEHGLQPSD